MGEKETTAAGSGDRTGQLNVSATPGGSAQGGAVLSAAVSSVGNLAPPPSNPASAAGAVSNPHFSEPGMTGDMPSI